MKGIYVIFTAVLLVSLFIALPVYAQSAPQPADDSVIDVSRVEELKSIQARNENSVTGIPGVQGIGIGLTEDGRELAFIVYVEKLSDTVKASVPASIESVPVRLIESGIFWAY